MGNACILVADDDRLIRVTFARGLREANYDCAGGG